TFDPAVFATGETIQMTGGPYVITNSVSIQGPAAGLTLDAGGRSGHFELAMTSALDLASISGLTLTHGGGDSASVAALNASLTLSRMVITNSMSAGISVGFFYQYARLSLIDSTVSGNVAGGVNIRFGDADISDSIISGNRSSSGGGINV